MTHSVCTWPSAIGRGMASNAAGDSREARRQALESGLVSVERG